MGGRAVNRLTSARTRMPRHWSPWLSSPLFHRLLALVAATIAMSGAPLFAHDMWMEPTTFAPEAGEIVGVRLRVGQDLLGEAGRRRPLRPRVRTSSAPSTCRERRGSHRSWRWLP